MKLNLPTKQRPLTLVAVLLAVVFGQHNLAVAQDEVVQGGAELRSVTMAEGNLEIIAPTVINLEPGRFASPVSVPLDVYYGFSRALTVGLSHSNGTVQGVGFYGLQQGVCLSGEASCEQRAYKNIGFDALYRLLSGVVQLAGHGGIDIRSFTSSALYLRAGIVAKAPLGVDVAILADPRVNLVVGGRNDRPDELSLPIGVQFITDLGIRVAVQTGLHGFITDYADTFSGALGVLSSVGVNEKMEAFASLVMPKLYGAVRTFDERMVVFGVNVRP